MDRSMGSRNVGTATGVPRQGGPQSPTCATCGAVAPDDGSWRLTWMSGVERGRTRWACDRCSRENLRSIEAKLDSEWW